MSTTNQTADRPQPLVDWQRQRRGHRFFPPLAERRRTPTIGTTESIPLADKVIHAKWFLGSWTWYAAEVDWSTGEAFGYVDGSGPEWGYFDLVELAEAQHGTSTPGGFSLVVERDCWWTARRFADIAEVSR